MSAPTSQGRGTGARAVVAAGRAAFAEALANRAALWTQAGAMALNDLAWVAFWLLFFDRVGEVRGWDASRVLLLFAVLTTAAGLVLGLLANARRIGQLAGDGELDALLALPVPPLAYLLLLLAAYPADIFTGAPKALLYTAVPAAFVAAVPARLIDEFDAPTAAALAGVAAVFALVGWVTFTLGLRRYTSGSLWTRA